MINNIFPKYSFDQIQRDPKTLAYDWQERVSDALLWPARLYLGNSCQMNQNLKVQPLQSDSWKILKTIAKVVFAIIFVPVGVLGALVGIPIAAKSQTHDFAGTIQQINHCLDNKEEYTSTIFDELDHADNACMALETAHKKLYDHATNFVANSTYEMAEWMMNHKKNQYESIAKLYKSYLQISDRIFSIDKDKYLRSVAKLMQCCHAGNLQEPSIDSVYEQGIASCRKQDNSMEPDQILKFARHLDDCGLAQDACNTLALALKCSPSNEDKKAMLCLLIDIYLAHGLNDSAEVHLEELKGIKSSNKDFSVRKGKMHYFKGDYDAAIKIFLFSRLNNHSDPWAHFYYGLCLFKKDRMSDAIDEICLAYENVKEDPDDSLHIFCNYIFTNRDTSNAFNPNYWNSQIKKILRIPDENAPKLQPGVADPKYLR